MLMVLVFAAVLLLVPGEVFAQEMAGAGALASQNLRGYTHMFIAYAIAWLLVVGWVISIARRLGRIEKTLND
jgi:CcmD family protein